MEIKASLLLIQIIKSALNQETIELDIQEDEWKEIYKIAQNNHVEGITYIGIKNNKNVPQSIYKRLKKEYDSTMYRQFLFENERKSIIESMEQEGLCYCFMKGINLVDYYPLPGMRFMADNDILYGDIELQGQVFDRKGKNDKEKEINELNAQKKLIHLMENKGYTCVSKRGKVDVFEKKPIYNFEMHRSLFTAEKYNYEYYKNPWRKTKQRSSYEFYMAHEDEYLYLLAHTFKHFDVSGCGIRCIIDLYVFLKQFNDVLNWSYIDQELIKMNLVQFHNDLKTLSLKCFKESQLDKENQKLLMYLIKSGTYGNADIFYERRYAKIDDKNDILKKVKYIYRRLFLSKEECKDTYPFLYRHMYLMPFFAIYRIGCSLILRPQRIKREIKFILKKNHNK